MRCTAKIIFAILLLPATLQSGGSRRFNISPQDLLNQQMADIVNVAVNYMVDDLWQAKQDVVGTNNNGRRFTVKDLWDKNKAGENEQAMNGNVDDLNAYKLDASSSSQVRRYTVHDIANPAQAEENVFAYLTNIDDIWQSKQDR